MTPLQFTILLHYYVDKSHDHPNIDKVADRAAVAAPAASNALELLLKEQLLVKKEIVHDNVSILSVDEEKEKEDEAKYKITARGSCYCNAVLNVPLPVWKVPF